MFHLAVLTLTAAPVTACAPMAAGVSMSYTAGHGRVGIGVATIGLMWTWRASTG